jgi:hypothetical protein
MMKTRRRLAMVALFGAALFGCGGGTSPQPCLRNCPVIPFTAGAYLIKGTSASNSSLNFTLAGAQTQVGDSTNGAMHFINSSCFPFSTDIQVLGSLGQTIFRLLSILPNNQLFTADDLTHPGGDPQLFFGHYAITNAGCLASDTGTLSVQLINFSGSWAGSLAPATGTPSTISLALTQSGPDIHGFFSGTGTASIAGGTCFSAAIVDPSTALVPMSASLVLADSSTGSTGKTVIIGDFSATGTFSGTYTSTEGACSEKGTVSLTRL